MKNLCESLYYYLDRITYGSLDNVKSVIKQEKGETFLEFIFGGSEIICGIMRLINMMKKDVYDVSGMIHINGEKNLIIK